ncbi:MAG: ribosome small subunit-dependent GTPase A [Lachnospiraceae bacterium]|nr:ribosome small subunit-dependent GTPase A [Lachnospiraceae bacterium]
MQGKIVKGIAGFYYVYVPEKGTYECKAKGIFRRDHKKPLVGDDVEVQLLDEQEKLGNIEKILPRSNTLIRPAVANVDQAMVIFSVVKPTPSFNLLDRFLITMEQQKIPCIICFNKKDIATEAEKEELTKAYDSCYNQILFVSAKKREGIDEIRKCLHGKTTTVAGPSGVGKSTIVNCLQETVNMETGAISDKIERGKHTTRHSQLITIDANTFILDTPGFSSLSIDQMEKEELASYYPEFTPYEKNCKFQGCAHIHEPVCGIKEALEQGLISRTRYDNYCLLYEELKNKKKY